MATNPRGERDYDGRRHRDHRRHDRHRRDRRDKDQSNSSSYANRNRRNQRDRYRRNEEYHKYYDHNHNFEAERYYDDQLDHIKFVDRAYGRMNDGLVDHEIEYVSTELDKRLDKELNAKLNAILDDEVPEPPANVRRLNGQVSVHQSPDDVKGTLCA